MYWRLIEMTELEKSKGEDGKCTRLDGKEPRYILDPFELISPDDSRYDTALTREEIMNMTEPPK